MSLLKSINLGLDQNGSLIELPEFIQSEIGNTMEDVRNFMVEFINVQFLLLKQNIAGHKMYVMNEDILYCNPKTDHLEPKNVLPVFEPFVDEAYNQIISMNWTAIYHRIYSCITQLSLLLNEENINLEDKNIDLTYDNAVLEEKYKAIQQQLQNKIHYGMDLIFRRAQQLKGENSQAPGFQYKADDFVKSKRAGRGQIDQLLKMNADLTANMNKIQSKYDELKKQFDGLQRSSQAKIQELTTKAQLVENIVQKSQANNECQMDSQIANRVIGTLNKLQQIAFNANHKQNIDSSDAALEDKLSVLEETITQYQKELVRNTFEDIYQNTKNKSPMLLQQTELTSNSNNTVSTLSNNKNEGNQSANSPLNPNDIRFVYSKDMNINQAIAKLKKEFKGKALGKGEYDQYPQLNISTDPKNLQKYQNMDKNQLIQELAKINQLYMQASQENSQLQQQVNNQSGKGSRGSGPSKGSSQNANSFYGDKDTSSAGGQQGGYDNSAGSNKNVKNSNTQGYSGKSGNNSAFSDAMDQNLKNGQQSRYPGQNGQFNGLDSDNKYITEGDNMYYIDSNGNKVKIEKDSAEYAEYKQMQMNNQKVADQMARKGINSVVNDIIQQYDADGNPIPSSQQSTKKCNSTDSQDDENAIFDQKDLYMKANNLEGLEKFFKDMFGIDINKIDSIAELKKLIQEKINANVNMSNKALEDMININIEHEGEVAILDKALEIFQSYYAQTRTVAIQVSLNQSTEQLKGDSIVVPNIENLSKAITKTNHFLRVNNQYFQVPGYCIDAQSVIDKINMQKRKANRNMTRKLDNTTKGYLNRTKTIGKADTPGLSSGQLRSPEQQSPNSFTQQQLMKIQNFQMNESQESKQFIQQLILIIQEQQSLLDEARKLLEQSNQNGKPECINLINRINDCGNRASKVLQTNLYSDYLPYEQQLRTPLSVDTQLRRVPTDQFNDRYSIINLNQIQYGHQNQWQLNSIADESQDHVPTISKKRLTTSNISNVQTIQNRIGTNQSLMSNYLTINNQDSNQPVINLNQPHEARNQHIPEIIAKQLAAQKAAEKMSNFLISSPKDSNINVSGRLRSQAMDKSLTQSQLSLPNKSHTSYQARRQTQQISKMADQQTLQSLFSNQLTKNEALKLYTDKTQGSDHLIMQRIFSRQPNDTNNQNLPTSIEFTSFNKQSDKKQLSAYQQEQPSKQNKSIISNNSTQNYNSIGAAQKNKYSSLGQHSEKHGTTNQEIGADILPVVLPHGVDKRQNINISQNIQSQQKQLEPNNSQMVVQNQDNDISNDDLVVNGLPQIQKFAGFGQSRGKTEQSSRLDNSTQENGLIVTAFGSTEQVLRHNKPNEMPGQFQQFNMSPSRIINYDQSISGNNINDDEPQLYSREAYKSHMVQKK